MSQARKNAWTELFKQPVKALTDNVYMQGTWPASDGKFATASLRGFIMQFEISTENFKATGSIVNGNASFKVRPRTQAARMVFKLMAQKKDQSHASASLDIVSASLAEFETNAAILANMRKSA